MITFNFDYEAYTKNMPYENLNQSMKSLLDESVNIKLKRLDKSPELRDLLLESCGNDEKHLHTLLESIELNKFPLTPDEIAKNTISTEVILKDYIDSGIISREDTYDFFSAVTKIANTIQTDKEKDIKYDPFATVRSKKEDFALNMNKNATASLNVDNKAFSFDIFEKGGIRNIKDYMNSKGEIAKHNLITLYKNIDLTKLSNDEIKSLNSFMREHDFSTEKKTHIVSKGENLTFISQRYGVKLNDLIKENRNIRNPNIIHIGDKFTIPLNEAEKKMIEIEEKMKENIDNSNKIDDPKKEVETKEKEQHIKVSASDIDIEKFTMHF